MALLQKPKSKTPNKVGVIDVLVGEKIRKARKAQKRPMASVAKTIGVTQQMLQRYETGKARMHVARFVLICRELNIPPHKMWENLHR